MVSPYPSAPFRMCFRPVTSPGSTRQDEGGAGTGYAAQAASGRRGGGQKLSLLGAQAAGHWNPRSSNIPQLSLQKGVSQKNDRPGFPCNGSNLLFFFRTHSNRCAPHSMRSGGKEADSAKTTASQAYVARHKAPYLQYSNTQTIPGKAPDRERNKFCRSSERSNFSSLSFFLGGGRKKRRGPELNCARGYNPDNVSLPPRRCELSLADIAALPRGADPAVELGALRELPEEEAEAGTSRVSFGVATLLCGFEGESNVKRKQKEARGTKGVP